MENVGEMVENSNYIQCFEAFAHSSTGKKEILYVVRIENEETSC